MAIEFNCHHCDKPLRTADDRAGWQAKCPGCGQVVSVPIPGEKSAANLERDTVHSSAAASEGSRPGCDNGMMPCPQCGEQIEVNALRCQYCGDNIERPGGTRARFGRHREVRPFPPGEVINEAFQIYCDRWVVLTIAFLVSAALSTLSFAACVIPVIAIPVAFNAIQVAANQNDEIQMLVAVLTFIMGIAAVLLATAFTIYLQTGFMMISLKAVRKQPAALSDLFAGGHYWARMVMNSFLFSLMFALGLCLCFVPGLFVAAIFLPFGFVLIDEDRPGINSLIRAKELTEGNLGSMFLIVIVGCLSNWLGSMACNFGLIIAAPFVSVMTALAYERMTYQTSIKSMLDRDDFFESTVNP